MIVKDEEAYIKKCLESVKNFVDEIIIVDTGSTDDTISICLEFGATVFKFDWNNNFSEARNYGIEKATKDWILWLDADERLTTQNLNTINKILDTSNLAIFKIKMRHIYEEEKPMEGDFSYSYRIFRNHKNIRFTGAIHEKLIFDEEQIPISQIADIEINHYGYMQKERIHKALRNLQILVSEAEKNQEDAWISYYIAAELYRLNDIQKAYYFVNQAIAEFLIKKSMPPAIAYKLKYDILIHSNSLKNSQKGIELAIEMYPDYVDLRFYKGVILVKQKKYEEAIKTFRYCLMLGEDHPDYLITAGNGSFRAYQYIGVCYEQLEQYDIAIQTYKKALLINPKLEEVIEKLENLIE